MMPAYRRGFLLVALATLVTDQVTKALMTAWLLPRGGFTVIPGLFDLTYVKNRGAVFGLFGGLGDPWRGVVLTFVPLGAIVLVAVLAWRSPAGRASPLLPLALVLGGAVGNLIDRLRLGAVVDFLDWHLAGHHWPAFNVADSAICVGVGFLLLHSFRS
ncbi:MAG: signal peptidase II [Acidobacteriota bacterium]